MWKISKRKFNIFCRKYITADNIKIVIFSFPLIYLFVIDYRSGEFRINDFLSVSILVSFILVVIFETISRILSKLVLSKTEDAMKLTEDYESLVRKYQKEKIMMIKSENLSFPITLLCSRKINDPSFKFKISHDNYKKKFELPKQIAAHSSTLFKAHEHSFVYNNMNIRLDGLECDEQFNVNLLYSKTTYFDSLLTNRAFDFPFQGTRTIREVFEPGPFLSSLSESRMSNHIGFSGFIELKDNTMIFIQRSNKVSIAKGKWGTSIVASLKVMHALNEHQQLTSKGISDAIRCEIKNELKINIPDEDLTKSIYAFYRDLVEGGKPHFLFYHKIDTFENHKDFEKHFYETLSTKSARLESKKELNIDGTMFQYFTLEQLKRCEFGLDYMKSTNGKKYPMMPSTVASIVLLLQSL